MDPDLKQLLFILGFVVVFGGIRGLIDVTIASLWFLGLVGLILVTFFKKDLFILGLKWIFSKFYRRCRY
jgi:hypothetical protein